MKQGQPNWPHLDNSTGLAHLLRAPRDPIVDGNSHARARDEETLHIDVPGGSKIEVMTAPQAQASDG
jgi:hypothetical protein